MMLINVLTNLLNSLYMNEEMHYISVCNDSWKSAYKPKQKCTYMFIHTAIGFLFAMRNIFRLFCLTASVPKFNMDSEKRY
jgi:hypothetical protein